MPSRMATIARLPPHQFCERGKPVFCRFMGRQIVLEEGPWTNRPCVTRARPNPTDGLLGASGRSHGGPP